MRDRSFREWRKTGRKSGRKVTCFLLARSQKRTTAKVEVFENFSASVAKAFLVSVKQGKDPTCERTGKVLKETSGRLLDGCSVRWVRDAFCLRICVIFILFDMYSSEINSV